MQQVSNQVCRLQGQWQRLSLDRSVSTSKILDRLEDVPCPGKPLKSTSFTPMALLSHASSFGPTSVPFKNSLRPCKTPVPYPARRKVSNGYVFSRGPHSTAQTFA